MWLLRTDRAELQFFSSPEEVEPYGGYAILSHVWGHESEEQTFEDLERIRAKCRLNESKAKLLKRLPGTHSQSTNPRDHVSEKIRQSCIIAKDAGYKWIWNDTCCIDKRSSSELSEAINSMYTYYSSAKVCFAYLADVDPEPLKSKELDDPATSTFRHSRWHKRGWTLQELIAPRLLKFYSKSWTFIGTKSDLVALLQDVTGIPVSVLIHGTPALRGLTVAQRLSWMAPRTTKRVEDRAYCLLGILGIHMTTLYGEGDKAFVRLQEKIMKISVDTSIFAWGAQISWRDLGDFRAQAHDDHSNSNHYLLSALHSVFRRSSQVYSSPPPADMLQEVMILSVSGWIH